MSTKATAAHQRYRNKTGRVVPGVTTIDNLLSKPALIPWAWKLGMAGQDYRKVTDKAASIGTITHYLVECFLKHDKPDLDEYSFANIKRAQMAFQEFEAWWKSQGLTAIGVEAQLVSEVMQCGGTLDCVALTPTAEYWLVDIKTSKGIYDEMKYQLAAYWAMWNENYPDKPIASSHIIHLSKETGQLVHYTYKSLFTELEIFRHLRMIYGLRKDKDPKRNLDRVFRKLTLDRL